jgi:zinc protease
MWGPDSYEAREATEAMVESVTPSDLSAMHDVIFQPGNLIIGVSGDFDEKAMIATLEKALAGWEMKARVGNPPAPSHDLQPGLYSVQKDINQGRVQIGHRGVERYNPDAIAIDVMNDILGGGGFTSRVMKTVRNDEGLAYGARTRFADNVWFPGEFVASFQSKNPTVALGTKLILEEMTKMRTEPVTQKELETAQKSFIETFPRRFESKPAMLQTFINDEFTDRPKDWWQTYRDRVRAVTAADVQRVAEEHLHPGKVAILVVGDWDAIYPGDIDGRASMADFYGGQVKRLPLLDPMTLQPLPMDEDKDKDKE